MQGRNELTVSGEGVHSQVAVIVIVNVLVVTCVFCMQSGRVFDEISLIDTNCDDASMHAYMRVSLSLSAFFLFCGDEAMACMCVRLVDPTEGHVKVLHDTSHVTVSCPASRQSPSLRTKTYGKNFL
jgi:hypothetical protein